MKKRDYKKRITSIVFTLTFLILSTLLIYVPKHNELTASISFLDNRKNFYIETTGINLEKNYPIVDEIGVMTKANTFKVVNDTNKDRTYRIVLKTGNKEKYDNIVDQDAINYSIKLNDGEWSQPTTLSENGIIYTGNIENNSEDTYQLKIWLNNNHVEKLNNKTFQGIISIYE